MIDPARCWDAMCDESEPLPDRRASAVALLAWLDDGGVPDWLDDAADMAPRSVVRSLAYGVCLAADAERSWTRPAPGPCPAYSDQPHRIGRSGTCVYCGDRA